jgi:type III restriction enzyme
VDQGEVRELDYEQDILFAVDWSVLDPAPLVAKIPDNLASAERQMRRIRLADSGKERFVTEVTEVTGYRTNFLVGNILGFVS